MSLRSETLAHYERMMEWARKQDKGELLYWRKMVRAINECWFIEDCPVCRANLKKRPCPLSGIESHRISAACLGIDCCDGLWNQMNDSVTWGEWLECAAAVVEYIKAHLPEDESEVAK